MNILITGATGYIGKHVLKRIIDNNWNVLILTRNYFNITYITDITNNWIKLYKGDILSIDDIDNAFIYAKKSNYTIDIVIHLAAIKISNNDIIDINLNGTKNIIKMMIKHNCNNIIFASSCSIYNNMNDVKENSMLFNVDYNRTLNEYAKSKYLSELYLYDISNKFSTMNIIILRCFNPIGSLEIKDFDDKYPNSIINKIISSYEKNILYIYEINNSTIIRDFIHVDDVAEAFIKSCYYIINNKCVLSLNIGTGKGTSVKELIEIFEKVNNIKINYKIIKFDKIVQCMYAPTPLLAEKY